MLTLPEWLRRTPAGREMIDQATEATVSEREVFVAEIEAAAADFAKVRPKLEAARLKAEEAVRVAREALAAEERRYQVAFSNFANASATFESRRAAAVGELRTTAPSVWQTKADLQDLRDRVLGRSTRLGHLNIEREDADRIAAEVLTAYRAIDDLVLLADPVPAVLELREKFGLGPLPATEAVPA